MIGNQRNAATILWRIKNFDYYDPRFHGVELTSPWMDIHILDIKLFCLYLKLATTEFSITLYMECVLDFRVDCEFSLLASDGSPFFTRTVRRVKITGPTSVVMPDGPTQGEILGTRRSEFLSRGTLSVRCRVLKSRGNIPMPETIYICNRIHMSEDCFFWPIEQLRECSELEMSKNVAFCPVSKELDIFRVKCTLQTFHFPNVPHNSIRNARLGFLVSTLRVTETLLLRLRVSMLGDGQEPLHLFDAEHLFGESEQIQVWDTPMCLFTRELREKMAKFRYDDSLNLFFHFKAVHQKTFEFWRERIGISSLELDEDRDARDVSCQTI